MRVREVTAEDEDAVRAIEDAAFGRDVEGVIADALRTDGDVLFELAAEQDEAVVGHIVFSRMRVDGLGDRLIAALGPVAVRPNTQRSGVGSALVRDGLARCAVLDVAAVFLLGDPAYYRRFGFRRGTALQVASRSAGWAFQAVELREGALSGVDSVDFAPAFDRA